MLFTIYASPVAQLLSSLVSIGSSMLLTLSFSLLYSNNHPSELSNLESCLQFLSLPDSHLMISS
jgi:hypothetical protein